MPRLASRLIALALLAAAGCAEEPPPDFRVRGAAVYVRTGAPFAHQADFPRRVEATLAAALAYWGGGWDQLHGTRITFFDGPYVPCRGTRGALGCYDGDLAVSTSDPGTGTLACVEQTVLVHEVGHAIVGDPHHRDPRWMGFEPLEDALAGGTGWTSGGAAACELFPAVWRHPPDA